MSARVERKPPGDWSQEDFEEETLLVRASDYDALLADNMALSQDHGKVERALESALARIRELTSELARTARPSTIWGRDDKGNGVPIFRPHNPDAQDGAR